MLDHLKRTLGWLVFLFFVLLPAIIPELFIPASLIGWGAAYVVLFIAGIGADTANTLPWMVADPDRHTFLLLGIAFAAGLVNGAKGVAGMMSFYGPMILLPGFMLNIGLAVENRHGWTGHLYENYEDAACEMGFDGRRLPGGGDRDGCVHTPKAGLPYPVFVTDSVGEITEVRPAASAAQRALEEMPAVKGASERMDELLKSLQ